MSKIKKFSALIRFVFVLVAMIIGISLIAQDFTINKALYHISDIGNLLYPAWSEDGSYIMYQSDKTGNWDIFAFKLSDSSVISIANSQADEQHPVWWPKHNAIAFDSYKTGKPYIFYYDMTKREVRQLFNRNISCMQPSFDSDGGLVCFSAFDRDEGNWQVFSYDFVYDNLNRLTTGNGQVVFPVFSYDGDIIVYQTIVHSNDTVANLQMINWYGKKLFNFNKSVDLKVNFSPDDWRIIYTISFKGGHQLQSMRKDGTSVYRLTKSFREVCCPAFSNDGKRLAVSIMQHGKYDIYIFAVEP